MHSVINLSDNEFIRLVYSSDIIPVDECSDVLLATTSITDEIGCIGLRASYIDECLQYCSIGHYHRLAPRRNPMVGYAAINAL